jgi:tetratricopeptide (TPR) repeat protein
MEAERWQQVKAIFQAALDLPPDERRAYVQTACAGDEELRREIDSLLVSEEDSDGFLTTEASNYVPGAMLDSDAPDANLGRRIGPYQIESEIGSGGMGSVYLAQRVDEFRQKAAIKLMRRGMDSRLVVSRFRYERQILAGLDHPNIARLLDGGATEDGRPYFVMEYVEGTPIDAYCHARSLPVPEILRLFRQVCAAVQYAHQNLVVHRDIKPGNILVTPDGTPKLLDFGIAKLIRQETAAETAGLTSMGVRLMTPEYASPEQVRGTPITTATDVYSLGVVLYELLAGRRPYEFSAASPVEVERTVCETEPRPPSAVEGGAASKRLSGDLDNIVLKALEKDPHRRYASVEQFSEDIRRHLEGVPVLARPLTIRYRTAKFVRRNRTAVVAGVLVFLSLTGGLVAASIQAHIARQQRARAERRFNDVRHLAESFLFEFHEKIKDLQGSRPARELIVQRALEYLGGLTQEAAGDASLSRELAEAYLKVGDVQGNPYELNRGDTAGALASYRQALEIAGNVVRRNPRDFDAMLDVAKANRSIANILPMQGDPAGGVTHLRQGISVLESALALRPHDTTAQLELSSCNEILGDVLGHPGLANLGDVKGARAAYEKALAADEALAASNERAHRGSAILRMKIADLELDANELAPALQNYQAAAVIFESVSKSDPTNASFRQNTIMIERKLAGAYEANGQNREALDQYLRVLERQRQVMAADPADRRARMGYMVILKSRADLLYKVGNHKEALPEYREVLELIRPMAEAQTDNTLLRGRYADILTTVGGLLAEMKEMGEAHRLYSQGLAIAKELADRSEATPDDVVYYAEYLMDCPMEDLQRASTAVAYARRAVAMNKEDSPDLLRKLARAYFYAGDEAAAVATQQKALVLIPPSPARTEAEEMMARFQKVLRKKEGQRKK